MFLDYSEVKVGTSPSLKPVRLLHNPEPRVLFHFTRQLRAVQHLSDDAQGMHIDCGTPATIMMMMMRCLE